MSGIKGDFTGFTFGNKHSSELGITRVSNGSRYDENLLPTIQDKTVQVPGGDGTYYFGSFYAQKSFNIPIAFDSLTEEEIRILREHFGNKFPQRLIFDEAPYKYYMAKVTSTPQIKTICFDEGGERIYKGEGTINFICYYPYAKSVFKTLNEYDDAQYPNKSEWATTSRMKSNLIGYDAAGASSINLFNAGDIEADFKLYLISLNSIQLSNTIKLECNGLTLKNGDSYVCVNSKNNLIEGCDSNYLSTGNIYNKYIVGGDFFKIPLGNSILNINGNSNKIEYEYIYY